MNLHRLNRPRSPVMDVSICVCNSGKDAHLGKEEGEVGKEGRGAKHSEILLQLHRLREPLQAEAEAQLLALVLALVLVRRPY